MDKNIWARKNIGHAASSAPTNIYIAEDNSGNINFQLSYCYC